MNFAGMESSLISRIVQVFAGAADFGEIVVQLAVAAGAISLAFFLARAGCSRVRVNERWKFGKGEFERVAFPLLAVTFVWIGKRVLERYQQDDGGPIELVVTLLAAFAAIRFAAYVLGHVIP